MTGASDSGRADALGRLARLTGSELREEWRRLFRAQPPSLSRDLLIRGLAYRIQELAEGGLSRSTLRRLSAGLADRVDEPPSRSLSLNLVAGTRLVREWHGRTYTVTVTAGGFEHEDRSYRSLSEIARAITGARWSGPRFFAPTRRDEGGRIGQAT